MYCDGVVGKNFYLMMLRRAWLCYASCPSVHLSACLWRWCIPDRI